MAVVATIETSRQLQGGQGSRADRCCCQQALVSADFPGLRLRSTIAERDCRGERGWCHLRQRQALQARQTVYGSAYALRSREAKWRGGKRKHDAGSRELHGNGAPRRAGSGC
jgi:hypothetical protein